MDLATYPDRPNVGDSYTMGPRTTIDLFALDIAALEATSHSFSNLANFADATQMWQATSGKIVETVVDPTIFPSGG